MEADRTTYDAWYSCRTVSGIAVGCVVAIAIADVVRLFTLCC